MVHDIPRILIIGGGTASGKTVLSEIIRDSAPVPTTLIPLDSYYRDRSELGAADRELLNYDHPDELEFSLLLQHLQALQRGECAEIPCYSFAEHRRLTDRRKLDPAPFIIVEGILALYRAEIRQCATLAVFVETSDETRFARRLQRDTAERGRSSESVHRQWRDTAQPMHLQYCRPSSSFADLIVNYEDFGRARDEIFLRLGFGRSARGPAR